MNRLLRLIAFLSVLALTFALSACASQPTPTPPPAPAPSPTPARLLPSAAAPGDIQPGLYDEVVQVDGQTRSYILYIPQSYDRANPPPLVLMLHGYSDSAANMVEWSGMNAVAEREGFVVAYLRGTGSPTAWNTGIVPGLAAGVDDVAYARAVIDALETRLSVDPRRVYAAGASMGAMMTFRLAAELSDRLAAVAAQAGTVGTKDRDGVVRTVATTGAPVSIITFHGKADPTIPYDGGEGDAGTRLSWLPVADSTAFSLRQNGCTGSPAVTTSPDGNIIQEDYTNCRDGSEVLVVTLVKANHFWPGVETDGLSATETIWQFFSRHARPD